METQDAAPEWMRVALGELGVHEAPGADNNARVQEYLASTTLGPGRPDSVPWCAAFVNWNLEKAGIKGTGKPNARSFLNWGKPIPFMTADGTWLPIPYGAILVFSRPPALWNAHVGFYVARQRVNLRVLSGNQGNSVCIKPYAKARLLAARWPLP